MQKAKIIKSPHVIWTSNRAYHGIQVQILNPSDNDRSGYAKEWRINAQEFQRLDHADFLGLTNEEQDEIRKELNSLELAAIQAMNEK